MKKFLLITAFSVMCINVFASTYEPEYVKVTEVWCDHSLGIDETVAHGEDVYVEITDAGYAYMEKHGYTSLLVEVKPKSCIWGLCIDSEKIKHTVLSKENGRCVFKYSVKSLSRCGEHEFEATVKDWY